MTCLLKKTEASVVVAGRMTCHGLEEWVLLERKKLEMWGLLYEIRKKKWAVFPIETQHCEEKGQSALFCWRKVRKNVTRLLGLEENGALKE